MKPRHWSLALVLLLINYLIFAALFTRLFSGGTAFSNATRTPVPTFTPAPAQPFITAPTLTPVPREPTPTATRVIVEPQAAAPAPAEPQQQPELVAPGTVNVRSGPGLNYEVIGSLNANTVRPIVGRNGDSSWWQIRISGDSTGWVSNSVVQPSNTGDVPVAEAPPPPPQSSAPEPAPQPAANSEPAPPPQPAYQYEPTGWYDDGNAGLTRFMGDILDANGSPVNGVFVQASCGDFSTISFPSGPTGWGTYQESSDWPAGFYDIVVDDRPVPCLWVLSIVETDDRERVKAVLSEAIPVEVTRDKSIIVANWRKNW